MRPILSRTLNSAALELRARQMRSSLTPSEQVLWSAIRGRRLGVQFRRQVPLAGRFIVDFFAPSVRLVVEVDGGYHTRRRRADERRDSTLTRLGYRVLRIEADLVLRDLPAATALVRTML